MPYQPPRRTKRPPMDYASTERLSATADAHETPPAGVTRSIRETAMTDFEITTCHADRVGHASITLKDPETGALVMIHQMPFEHDYDETVREECRRIQQSAANIGQRALSFLQRPPREPEVHPAPAPGAAPHPDEPPNAFDQEDAPRLRA